MLVRVGSSTEVLAGQMRVFDVAGVRVKLVNADRHLYAGRHWPYPSRKGAALR